MQRETWDLDNKWLNDFSESFVHGTQRLIRNISIDIDSNSVVVRGGARSYYAVQLAIHATRMFSQERPRFAETVLLLSVDDRPLELNLTHTVKRKRNLKVSTGSNERHPKLTFA